MNNSTLLRLFLSLMLPLTFLAQAQDNQGLGCASDRYREALRVSSPEYRQKEKQLNDQVLKQVIALHQRNGRTSASSEIYTIPVVVHVMHLPGTALGTGENISDAQVQQAIKDLNDGFRNSNAYNVSNGVDLGIEFKLAQRTPSCAASSGINRVATSLSNLTYSEQNDASIKQLSYWSSTDYLNIWVVNEVCYPSCGVNGYATTPVSHGFATDGVLLEARTFGNSTNGSKITLHEVGHYLNLDHTFEGGCVNNNCLTDGDKVCDTPPRTDGPFTSCSQNTCSTDENDHSTNNPFRPVAMGGLGDQLDLTSNYMDYTLSSCKNSFTAGQKDRMLASLLTTRKSLISSKGSTAPGSDATLVSACLPDEAQDLYPTGIEKVSIHTLESVSKRADEEGTYANYLCKKTPPVLTLSTTYPITIVTGGFENVRVYIDYNNDGVFSESSELALISPSPSTGFIAIEDVHERTVVMPSSATLNTALRMRVISEYEANTITDACYDPLEGQVEDYAVILSAVATAVQGTTQGLELEIYPNPTDQQTTVKLSQASGDDMEVELADVMGRKIVLTSDVRVNDGSASMTISKEQYQLNPGMYTLTVRSGKKLVTKKIIFK